MTLLLAATAVVACQSFPSIRQSSMSRFTNNEFAQGQWFVQATNEVAVPNRSILHCPCNVYQVSLPGPSRLGAESYEMKYTAACGDRVFGFHNLTIPLEGYWNATYPALHYENYAHASSHWPTMIFNASFDAGGAMEWLSVYACDADGKESFQLLSRRVQPLSEEIESYVNAAAGMGLNVSGLESVDFTACRWASNL